MNENTDINVGVWFVYDGECPICSYAAAALRLKREFGSLTLLDARKNEGHPLLKMIKDRHYDLDRGMVIYQGGTFYHGKEALVFMAREGGDMGAFNKINSVMYKNEHVAAFLYPFLRFVRNMLLKLRGRQLIDNLTDRNEPIFKTIFGAAWDELPIVMKRHYANRPYSSDRGVVDGVMDVESSPIGRVLAPFFKLSGTLVPYEGRDVPAKVEFLSNPSSNGLHFNRTFYFPNKKPYEFRSVMLPMGGNEMAEVMRFGLYWHLAFIWTGTKVILEHRGYGVHWFGEFIPLPLALFMGKGYADETPINDDSFSMSMKIVHPIWGMVFGYSGIFKMVKDVA